MVRLIRSAAFWLVFAVAAVPFGILAIAMWIGRLPFSLRFRIVSLWAGLGVHWLRLTCGVKWRVEGAENIPSQPCIIAANHQSTWETLFLQQLFRPQSWVLKRSLFWIPFFGWGLRSLEPVAIDRSRGRAALRQIIDQGTPLLEHHRWIVIFPEGTRLATGQTRRWGSGASMLATHSGYPIVPLAHDSGRCWPRGSLVFQPGTITVRIGPPIAIGGRTADQLTEVVRAWVENHRPDLPSSQSSG
ncbi:MAG: lysophospholipid acyltransferase family protein [Pseudomonadota bacterium]